ncbi:phosphatidate cytidylyltransferase, mitochondrial [Trichomonascus vanleenenianus]|uniref:putative phosphatidate cytidylyltransferase n=1 Tax=Trichomonascus vanleenenianus TaxID=2268995 RepID=UPI003ECACCFE
MNATIISRASSQAAKRCYSTIQATSQSESDRLMAALEQNRNKKKEGSIPLRFEVPREKSPSQQTPYSSPNYFDLNVKSYNKINKFSDLPKDFGNNQHMSIDNELRERLRSTLWKFRAPIRYAFAYGSGVFSQGKASQNSNPQIDLIFGVSHSQHWHSLNMKQYPEHYSSLQWLGSNAVSLIQDKCGAGLYFNPYVEMNGLKIKYGVVNMDTLLTDLADWSTLYMAGRLHKPVKILRDEPRLRFVNQANLISVLRASLLLLPERFTEYDLYMKIAGISYMGDPRMTFGENPNKVRNIVDNQFLHFRELYSPLMDSLPNLELASTTEPSITGVGPNRDTEVASLVQDMDPVKRGNMVVRLPVKFKSRLYGRYASAVGDGKTPIDSHQQQAKEKDVEKHTSENPLFCTEFDQRIAADKALPDQMSHAIRQTVAWPSLTQSMKGILTAGVGRSIRYSAEKLKKYYSGKNNLA